MRIKKTLALLLILSVVSFMTGCHKMPELKESSDSAAPAAKITAKETSDTNQTADGDPNAVFLIQCKKDGKVDDTFADIINQQLSLLPENLQSAFVQDGWSVYVTDKDIAQTYYKGEFDHVMATTNYEELRILIESRQDAAYESPIHEVGHWMDYYLDFPSTTDEFAAIYDSDKSSFITAYHSQCIDNELEFFAEGFWQYIVDPDRLLKETPGLYRFIYEQYCLMCARFSAFKIFYT